MKKLLSVIGACVVGIAATARPASAQADATIGYEFAHSTGSGSDDGLNFPLGVSCALAARAMPNVSLVGEFDWSRHSETLGGVDLTGTAMGFGAGIRFQSSDTANIKPFVQVIAGVEHDSVSDGAESDSGTHFMLQPGGGVEIAKLVVVAIDFRKTFAGEDTHNFGDEYRIFFGIRLDF